MVLKASVMERHGVEISDSSIWGVFSSSCSCASKFVRLFGDEFVDDDFKVSHCVWIRDKSLVCEQLCLLVLVCLVLSFLVTEASFCEAAHHRPSAVQRVPGLADPLACAKHVQFFYGVLACDQHPALKLVKIFSVTGLKGCSDTLIHRLHDARTVRWQPHKVHVGQFLLAEINAELVPREVVHGLQHHAR